MNVRSADPAHGVETISVLLIEDDMVDEMATLRTVVREALPYEMQVVRSVVAARTVLARCHFDVILADYQLPDGTAFDLMADFADQVVIFITGAWEASDAALALREGVHDYLIKDDEGKYLKLLNYRVQTALRLQRTARALQASEARLQAILDHAPASIAAWDASGQPLLSNRHHLRHDGLPGRPTACNAGAEVADECEETLVLQDGSTHTYLTVRFPVPGEGPGSRAIGAISVDITERKNAEQKIRQLAFFDPLTSLPNRRLLIDRLQQVFATSARHACHGAVFFIDLDHFKQLNDTLGHDHGDLLLIEVAKRLLACVRGEDTVARIGGDEFVVMAVSLADDAATAAEQAALVGEKIVAAISAPCQLGTHLHRVTPSIGVSLFRGRDLSVDEVLKRADVAMYQAKAAGRGTLRCFDPLMQAALASRTTLEHELRRALDNGQLCLHFQGQVDGQQGTVGVEALLRWDHPQRGLLLPESFMAVAEHSGLALPIGQWVLDAACAQLARWSHEPALCHLRLAVNVGIRQFRTAGFADGVAQALRQHGVVPSRLRLELREAMVQGHAEQALACMTRLGALGVSFAIEDFGIGLSSLQQLKRLPLQEIKIAQSLMPSIASSAHDAALVRTIIGIGRELGIDVLASGVETDAQRLCLQALGCSLWQGYLFGRPAPLNEFERRLAALPATAARCLPA